MPRTRRSRLAAIAAILVVVPLTSACSMLFMTRPPKAEGPVARGDCTRSVAAPLIDGFSTLNSLALVAGVYGPSRDDFDSDEDHTGYLVSTGINAAALALSSIQGFRWSAECRSRNALSEQAIRDHLRVLAAQRR